MQVGVFNTDFVSSLAVRRAAEMEKFRWLAGEWHHENHAPAGRLNPAERGDTAASTADLIDRPQLAFPGSGLVRVASLSELRNATQEHTSCRSAAGHSLHVLGIPSPLHSDF